MIISEPGISQTKYLRDNFWIENYTKKDGLPENIVTSITQDKKGYLWLTTPYKLVCFDGYEFKVFDPRKDFPNRYFHFSGQIIEDDNGMFWMTTQGMGLFSFNPRSETFQIFDASNSQLKSDDIYRVAMDNSGNLWAATLNGLSRVFRRAGKIEIDSYVVEYPDKLLKLVDEVTAKRAVAAITKVVDRQFIEREISISDETNVLVYCLGESFDEAFDYGWIENKTGTKVWSFQQSKSFHAGGASKNKFQLDVVTLAPGRYRLKYVSDDSHSWNRWNEAPPRHPEYWGIQLFDISKALSDTIQGFITETLKQRPFAGTNFLSDSRRNLWAVTSAALEKLRLDSGKLTSQSFSFPPTFRPSSTLAEYDTSRFIIIGSLYDSAQKKEVFATLIYDHKKNSYTTATTQDQFLKIANNFILRDKRSNLWLSTFNEAGQGLYFSKALTTGGKFQQLKISPSDKESFEQLWAMFEDRQGFIWLGSRQHGLYKINPEPAPVFYVDVGGTQDKLQETALTEIHTDVNGRIWLSSDDKIICYNPVDKTTMNFPTSGEDKEGALFINGNNTVYVSEVGHLRQFDETRKKLVSTQFEIPDSLRFIGWDSYNNAWCEHWDRNDPASLFILKDHKFVPASFDSSTFSGGFYRDFYLGRNGNIWLSPAFDGLDQYQLNSKTKTLTFVRRYLPHGVDVQDIHEQENGIIWMATYDGLVRLDPLTGTHTYFRKSEGLPSDGIAKLIPFRDKLWIITDLGTAFVNTNDGRINAHPELDEFIRQNNPGYFSRPPNFFDWATETASDEILMVGNGGFFHFRPETFVADSVRPVLHLTKLNVNGQAIPLFTPDGSNKKLHFNYAQNDLEIEFAGIHFKNPRQNQYSYRLSGNDEDWVFVDHARVARFSNLSSGHYEFYLKAANADGLWSEPQKMFAFTILPPWWQTWWAYSLYALIGVTGILAYVSYRSRELKKENVLLEEKVTQRTDQLNQSLENLKAAQTQLIHSEKMASLGELTAGIAHEIQNPLNFINNFSDVNMELLDELKSALENGDHITAITISRDISGNEEKIKQHGSRADGIVKGMLQHSRTSRGAKEPTDLNSLLNEYLRLSYHGIRAKDKSFNVKLNTDLDQEIGTTNIVSQDIGRVLLNLFNNSFYSVMEKSKKNVNGYEPTVSVSTRRAADKIEVRVKDNGVGIPKHILDKIFQPFFTTKPPGQGTGLGLSISYDMIAAHGGEMKVNTEEGEYAEFIITLPV